MPLTFTFTEEKFREFDRWKVIPNGKLPLILVSLEGFVLDELCCLSIRLSMGTGVVQLLGTCSPKIFAVLRELHGNWLLIKVAVSTVEYQQPQFIGK